MGMMTGPRQNLRIYDEIGSEVELELADGVSGGTMEGLIHPRIRWRYDGGAGAAVVRQSIPSEEA